jgi:hypothetical protein
MNKGKRDIGFEESDKTFFNKLIFKCEAIKMPVKEKTIIQV